jgi:hypothetical protein
MATLQENLKYSFKYVATKPGVIDNRICDRIDCLKAALSSGVASLQFIFASATIVIRGSNESVTFLYLEPWQAVRHTE